MLLLAWLFYLGILLFIFGKASEETKRILLDVCVILSAIIDIGILKRL